jgi:hypothetical protein
MMKGCLMAEEAIRYRQLRSDAKIGSVTAELEKTLGLPVGSVQLVKSDGKRIRADATIGTLRAAWDD